MTFKKSSNEIESKPKMKTLLWLSKRFLFSKQILFDGSAPLAFFGLVLGVAALVASMSVMRGYKKSLKQAMVDVTGDIQVVKRGKLIEDWKQFEEQIKGIDHRITNMARFAYTEAVIANQGQVSGVLVQGINSQEVNEILNIKNRILKGHLPSDKKVHETSQLAEKQFASILVGNGLAKKLKLELESEIYLAVSLATPFEDQSFNRKAEAFKVSGIVDFGKNDWNERLVMIQLSDFQNLTQIGQRYTGAFVKLNNSDAAIEVSRKFEETLGPRFAVLNWYEVNKNLFEAVDYETVVIFFVVFLIVFVAAFNIASTLYVLVRQRFFDIAILKALGATRITIQKIFLIQGFLVSFFGTVLGAFVGILLSQGFMFLQIHFQLISGTVYKIDRIDVSISLIDLFIIYLVTTVACVLAAYFPAKSGSELDVVKGLKYE